MPKPSLRHRVARWLLKSLEDVHPEVLNREHLMRLFSDEESAAPSTFRTFASDYNITTWVHTAVRKWQDAFASLRVRVVDEKGEEKKNELNALFDAPNPHRSFADISRQYIADMALGGESGMEFVRTSRGRIIEMWPHQPSDFFIHQDKARLAYYGVAGYTIERSGVKKYDLPPSDFLHTKFYNPLNPWRGISPMSAIRMSVAIEQLASAWSKMFFDNGAHVGGVIIAPQGLTQKERDALESKFQEKTGLSRKGAKWHSVVALEQGIMDYKSIGSVQKDMQWAETRRLTRNEIGGVYGVPDELMGFGKDTYENFERALLTFWSETVTPQARLRDDNFTFFFRREGLLDADESLRSDFSKIPVLARLLYPVYQLALWLFQMGVPFNRIDEHLHLGVGNIGPVGDLSFPSGSAQTLDPKGEVVVEASTPTDTEGEPKDDDESEGAAKEKVLRIVNALKTIGVAKV